MSYFNFVDGGERSPGSFGYYAFEGVTGIVYGATIDPSLITISYQNNQYYFQMGTFYANAINNGAYNLSWSPTLPSVLSSSTIYFGMRMYTGTEFIYSSYTTCYTTIYFCNANGNPQVAIRFNSNGSLTASSGGTISPYNGVGSSTLGVTSNYLINLQTVIYLEFYLVVSASSGALTIKLNGNPTAILTLTGINTASDTTSLPITSFQFCNGGGALIRDMYVMDGTGAAPFNTFLGDVTAQYQPPTANVSAQFTANGNASNYLNAAETPPIPGTDYNSSSTVGNADTFSITSLATDTSKAFAVKLFDYSYKSDTGSRSLAKTITSGSSTGTGAINYLNTTATVTTDIFTVNPNGGGTWTTAAVNALTVGYRVNN
jgi:hypothetical protein